MSRVLFYLPQWGEITEEMWKILMPASLKMYENRLHSLKIDFEGGSLVLMTEFEIIWVVDPPVYGMIFEFTWQQSDQCREGTYIFGGVDVELAKIAQYN